MVREAHKRGSGGHLSLTYLAPGVCDMGPIATKQGAPGGRALLCSALLGCKITLRSRIREWNPDSQRTSPAATSCPHEPSNVSRAWGPVCPGNRRQVWSWDPTPRRQLLRQQHQVPSRDPVSSQVNGQEGSPPGRPMGAQQSLQGSLPGRRALSCAAWTATRGDVRAWKPRT